MDEIDELKIKEMIEENRRTSEATMKVIQPVFEKIIDISIPTHLYANDVQYNLVYENKDNPFCNAFFMGCYIEEEQYMDIDIKSEEGFDHFFDIFPTAPKIDIEHINQVINDFRFMYAFILGKDVFHQVTCVNDLKDNYRWDGENYRFTVRLFDESVFDQKHFSISVFYHICTKTSTISSTYRYDFKHPDIRFASEDFSSLAQIKKGFFEHVAKMMHKPIGDIKWIDYKVLPMLNC